MKPQPLAWLAAAACCVVASADGATWSGNGDPVLVAYVEAALAQSPRLEQARLELSAAAERVPQARALPDPAVVLTRHVLAPETRLGPRSNGLALTQRLPWFGKRAEREAHALERAEVRAELVRLKRAQVVHETKLAYYDLARIDRAIDIAAQERELLRHYESLATARYSQGIGLQQAVVKLQAEITRSHSRDHELRRQRTAAQAQLNALLDRPAGAAVATVALPSTPLPAAGRNPAEAPEGSPDARVALRNLQAAQAGLALARREQWPDPVLGLAWGQVDRRRDAGAPTDSGDDILSLTIGVTLPVQRSAHDARVREARATLAAAREAHRGALIESRRAVRTAAFDLGAIDDQIALMERALLPQAEQALRSAEEAYATGTAGMLELLDSEEVLLDVRLGLARLTGQYMQTLALVERLTGVPFPGDTP